MLARLLRLLRGDNRDYAPTAPILLDHKLSEMLNKSVSFFRYAKQLFIKD